MVEHGSAHGDEEGKSMLMGNFMPFREQCSQGGMDDYTLLFADSNFERCNALCHSKAIGWVGVSTPKHQSLRQGT